MDDGGRPPAAKDQTRPHISQLGKRAGIAESMIGDGFR